VGRANRLDFVGPPVGVTDPPQRAGETARRADRTRALVTTPLTTSAIPHSACRTPDSWAAATSSHAVDRSSQTSSATSRPSGAPQDTPAG
jgi:hypothetical protein